NANTCADQSVVSFPSRPPGPYLWPTFLVVMPASRVTLVIVDVLTPYSRARSPVVAPFRYAATTSDSCSVVSARRGSRTGSGTSGVGSGLGASGSGSSRRFERSWYATLNGGRSWQPRLPNLRHALAMC